MLQFFQVRCFRHSEAGVIHLSAHVISLSSPANLALLILVVLYKDSTKNQKVCAALPRNTDSVRGYTICTAVKFTTAQTDNVYVTINNPMTDGEYDTAVSIYAEFLA